MDGHFARKYNITTRFGDLYDHISDICKTILILGTLYYIDSSKFVTVFIIFILVGSISLIHLGCQEIIMKYIIYLKKTVFFMNLIKQSLIS